MRSWRVDFNVVIVIYFSSCCRITIEIQHCKVAPVAMIYPVDNCLWSVVVICKRLQTEIAFDNQKIRQFLIKIEKQKFFSFSYCSSILTTP